jgi:hypothetical protein
LAKIGFSHAVRIYNVNSAYLPFERKVVVSFDGVPTSFSFLENGAGMFQEKEILAPKRLEQLVNSIFT